MPPQFNPITFLAFGLGYAGAMFLMLAVSVTLRLLSILLLKVKITKF